MNPYNSGGPSKSVERGPGPRDGSSKLTTFAPEKYVRYEF